MNVTLPLKRDQFQIYLTAVLKLISFIEVLVSCRDEQQRIIMITLRTYCSGMYFGCWMAIKRARYIKSIVTHFKSRHSLVEETKMYVTWPKIRNL